ncbi:MAG: flotillin-like FloA family protein, partial [Gemmatimonadota bacterium]
ATAQEMKAKVIEAEAQLPLAMAEAFRKGLFGVIDYQKYKNLQADTAMRQAIAGQTDPSASGQAS